MSLYENVVAEIEALPDGPQIGALFDFDGTIIAGYSAVSFIREQVVRGDLSVKQIVELTSAMTRFGMGDLGFSAMMAGTMQFLRGTSEEVYNEFAQELYDGHLAKLIYPESRALIETHMRKGHTVAIISSATPYQVEPAARDLGIEHVYCTRLEIKKGEFTGRVIHPTCFGPGKVTAAESLAADVGLDLANCYFYSDSMDDIELLEEVGHPRPLNPSKELAEIAKERNWPARTFDSRGRRSISNWVRTLAATGSLATSFAAGLPIWAVTKSRRSAQNFSLSLFGETASALIGLKLKINNEHHLWEQRPAVFIFNHQSKADVIIIASLLRRDLAGVGKQEIKNIPILGQVMQLGGAVLIDRRNAASAIEAMKPLIDVMRVDGKSVAMAPEGTRSATTKLGPFKKGAFHLAMQAGVPIVPIVIHNATDVAPKGEFVFRPATVEVTVLDPVDTSAWHSSTMNQHVKDVRDLFLAALGQSERDSKPTGSVSVGAVKKPAATKPKWTKKTAKKKATKKTTVKKTPTSAKKAAGKKAVKKAKTVRKTSGKG